jgi:uncharacterized membrane protein required for colicin V production
MLPSSLFDIFLIIVVFLFSVIGYFRGFSKEFSSFLTLISAILFSYFLAPIVSPIITSKFSYSKVLIDILTRFLLFITIYFLIFLMTHKVQNILSDKIPSSINGSLGFIFSFCKIYLIFSLLFSGMIYIYSHGSSSKAAKKIGPKWLTNSISYNFLDFGKDIVEPAFVAITKNLIPSIKKGEIALENIKAISEVVDVDLENVDSKKNGYSKKDIQGMSELIKNISK